MPTTIVLPGKRRIRVDVIQGVVIDNSKSSALVIHQERDQHQYVGGTVIMRPGRLHSEVVSIHKVWLRATDGKKSAYNLSDFPLDVRIGHDLSLIYGAAEGIDEGSFFGAMNRTTGQLNFDKSIHCDCLASFGLYLPPKFRRKLMKKGLVFGTTVGLLSVLFGGDSSVLVASVIFGLILSLPMMLVQGVAKQLQVQRLVPELNRRASELRSNKGSPAPNL